MASHSVGNAILRRIQASRGSVWSAKDLLDLGTRSAVDQALRRLVRDGKLRKVARGLYDYPRSSKLVGTRAPVADNVAKAAARSKGAKVRLTGAAAANALGLTLQVPVRATYITDGPSQQINLNGRRVVLKRVSPKRLAISPAAGTVVEALRYLGRDGVKLLKESDIRRIAWALDARDTHQLKKALRTVPDWMYSTVLEVIAHTFR
jgi:hypothetical protein